MKIMRDIERKKMGFYEKVFLFLLALLLLGICSLIIISSNQEIFALFILPVPLFFLVFVVMRLFLEKMFGEMKGKSILRDVLEVTVFLGVWFMFLFPLFLTFLRDENFVPFSIIPLIFLFIITPTIGAKIVFYYRMSKYGVWVEVKNLKVMSGNNYIETDESCDFTGYIVKGDWVHPHNKKRYVFKTSEEFSYNPRPYLGSSLRVKILPNKPKYYLFDYSQFP